MFFFNISKGVISVLQFFVSDRLDSICQMPSAVLGSEIGPCVVDDHGDTFQKGHVGDEVGLPTVKVSALVCD